MAAEGESSNVSFQLYDAPSNGGPRRGRLSLNNIALDTPAFIAPTSRGAVPHLSQDNLRDHTDIRAVYVALEDFIEKCHSKAPVYNHPSTLRVFTAHPAESLQVLAPRRSPPVTTATSNTDSTIAILTSVGFRSLKVDDYITGVVSLCPDIAIAPPDLPHQTPGKNRGPKMVFRTEMWLGELIKKTSTTSRTPIFASLLPLGVEMQSYYLEYLKENISSLSGLALYDSRIVLDLPGELELLPRMSLDDPGNPHKVLEQVGRGIDMFNLPFLVQVTDAGIALNFTFPGEGEGELPLGVNLWDASYATSLDPLSTSCLCYACRRHHRAYIQHLLATKEMAAWVLLQIHNTKVISEFFTAVRESISRGTFEQDRKVFAEIYEADLPKKTGQGPRLRGYQFKSEHGAKRRNPKAFGKLGGDRKSALEEAVTPPLDMTEEKFEEGGFAVMLFG